MTPPRPRVVVTGIGAVSPLGVGVERLWEGCLRGESGIRRITSFDPTGYTCQVAGEVPDFVATDFMDRKAARRMARFAQFAVACTVEALADAELDVGREDRTRVGVIIGNGIGGLHNIQAAVRLLDERGPMRLEPLVIPRVLSNMAASNVSMQFGLLGYNSTVVTACAAGTQAIGEAAEVIRRGAADVMITGGSEAAIVEVMIGAFAVMRALTSRNDDPPRASRPSTPIAMASCRRRAPASSSWRAKPTPRRATRRCTPRSRASGPPPTPTTLWRRTNPATGPCGPSAWRCKTRACGRRRWTTSTPTAPPLRSTTPPRRARSRPPWARTPITFRSGATKSMIGHVFGAAGALESIAAIRSIETGRIHPTINLESPDPECDLDYVPDGGRQADLDVVLKNSFGFGGQNACLVLRRYPPPA